MANLELEKKLNRVAFFVTALVLLLVGAMRRPQFKITLPEGVDLSFLPAFHSSMNILTAIALIIALWFIKKQNMKMHRNFIYAALGFSALFLLSYVAYHFTSSEVLYGDANGDGVVDAAELAIVGSMRTVYLIILATHIITAAVIFPFILFTFIRAFTGQYDRHKKMARWVFPVWLFVAISGPVCFFMLKPYY